MLKALCVMKTRLLPGWLHKRTEALSGPCLLTLGVISKDSLFPWLSGKELENQKPHM